MMAARLGDMTAHGGSIVVGFPTVLIGGMPAARLADMHVCPMMTPGVPPIPHVGGPISGPGAPTVLIGGMPAARMGDMLVCVGPPDVILAGCPTVMIGMAGMGGGSMGTGGGGPGAAAAAQAAANAAVPLEPEELGPMDHWFTAAFVDSAGLPVSGVPFRLTVPGEGERRGVLGASGRIRRAGLPDAGTAEIVLESVSGAAWSTDAAAVADDLTLQAQTTGFDDGQEALFEVWQADLHGADRRLATLRTQVQGDAAEARWRFEYPEPDERAPYAQLPERYSAPSFYFVARVGPREARSGPLLLADDLEIELKDAESRAIGSQPFEVTTASGERRTGRLDGSGSATVGRVPAGPATVRFPDLPDQDAQAEQQQAEEDAPPDRAAPADAPPLPPGTVSFQLCGPDGAPLPGEAYTLEAGGRSETGTTDRHGYTQPFRPRGASSGTLTSGDATYEIEFVSELTGLKGVQAMLNALGYAAGAPDGRERPETRAALEAFQRAASLPVTGEPDGATRFALRSRYTPSS